MIFTLFLFEVSNLNGHMVLGILIAILFVIILYFVVKMLELLYVMIYKKPWYTHLYLFPKTLTKPQKDILRREFPFYNKLSKKYKLYFEHRVASFIVDKDFIGRDGLVVNDEVKVLISAIAVKLTFGFRDYFIEIISKIVVYPEAFYSSTNDDFHKGEFNPKLKTLVLSWSDFKMGLDIDNDNLNLGIHEFTHAMHFNSIKGRDVSSSIFSDTFKELTALMQNKPILREKLVQSNYFRRYAFTNQFEFLAVIMETFIETPNEFKSNFPEVYRMTKQMLNFNFPDY